MGVLSDRLDAMEIVVTSPSGGVQARLTGRTQVSIAFAAGSYRRYTEEKLAGALVHVARLLWAARTREYYAARSAAAGELIVGESPARTPSDHAFERDRTRLVAEGASADQRVRVSVRGMQDWTIRITAGTVRALTEDQFAACVAEAADDLIADQLAKIRLLKEEHYADER